MKLTRDLKRKLRYLQRVVKRGLVKDPLIERERAVARKAARKRAKATRRANR